MKTRKPSWVYVYWSESNKFKKNSLIFFTNFERTCRQVARENGLENGYDKTKIKVLFDDGFEYECRLDVSEKEDTCFEKHCTDILFFVKYSEKFKQLDTSTQALYLKIAENISKIDFSRKGG